MAYPRTSFKYVASQLATKLKKTWCGKLLEHLIQDKPRRKSSAASSGSKESGGSNQGEFRNRLNSMDDAESGSMSATKKLLQVDDVIDEKDEIDREERKK